MRSTWTFPSAYHLVFGRHAVHQLGDIVRSLPAKRLFVVTDHVLIEAGGWEPVHAGLSVSGIAFEMFEGGQAEPALKLAGGCAAVAKKVGPAGGLGSAGGSEGDVWTETAL